jgi:hypothetical protein
MALVAGWLTGVPAFVQAQGVTATPAAKPSAANTDIQKLRQQLAKLEERIEELEKPDVEAGVDPDETARQEARDKTLERRLAALEKSAADSGSKKDTPKPDDDDGEESITVRAPFVVHDKAGRTIFRIDTVDDDRPVVVIGNSLAGSVVMGINPEGQSAVRLFDAQRHAAVVMVAKGEGGYLSLQNTANKESVMLSVDQSGAGRVKVFNTAGRAVTALTSDNVGGRVLVVDAKSGLNTVTLSTGTEGGLVNVYAPQGGKPHVSMTSYTDGGEINVYNSSGVPTGAISSGKAGAGRLVLTDADGLIMVESGMLKGGTGIVRTGPAGDGPAGVVGGTVRPASSIQGRK